VTRRQQAEAYGKLPSPLSTEERRKALAEVARAMNPPASAAEFVHVAAASRGALPGCAAPPDAPGVILVREEPALADGGRQAAPSRSAALAEEFTRVAQEAAGIGLGIPTLGQDGVEATNPTEAAAPDAAISGARAPRPGPAAP
jgi:hypothetical protein